MAFGNHRPAYETYFRTASFPPPAPPLGGCIGSFQDHNWVELLIIPFRPEAQSPHRLEMTRALGTAANSEET
jgi:hypothetical protein